VSRLPRPAKAVIFDMDGLLFDTERLYCRAMTQAAAELGETLPLELYLGMIGLPGLDNMAMLAAHYGEAFDVKAFWAASRARFHELAEVEIGLKAGVVELLDHLDALDLPRAIATTSRRESADHHLAAHGLTARFDAIVAHGDYERGKPHPDPYLKAAEILGVAPRDCLVLEDSHNGVRSAAAAGAMAVMAPDMLPATDEMRGLCVEIVEDLHAVRGLLGG